VAETQTADASNAKKKRRKPDPNAPKKPKLPRDLYVESKLARIKRKNPLFSHKEAVAHTKQKYDDLTEEAREKYVLEAKELGLALRLCCMFERLFPHVALPPQQPLER
jgi:hypothetical protein